MGSESGGSGKGDRYHHGGLRRALLDAALGLADERGVGGFSMREVSRRAGVSHNAPYHHFAGKGALVEELATESFEALAGALGEARTRTGGDAGERLSALGVAYVRFAVRNPARFRFMFRPELRSGYRPELRRSSEGPPAAPTGEEPRRERAAMGAYRVLLDAVGECQRAGLAAPGDPATPALTAWSTVHGLSVLVLDGPGGGPGSSAEEAERAAGAVTETLARGLLPRRGPATDAEIS